MDLIKLWNQLLGKDIDDKTLLVQEQKKVERLKEATKVMQEKQEVRRQLVEARKEARELEVGLGRRSSRLIVYIAGIGGLLVIVLIMKSCMGC